MSPALEHITLRELGTILDELKLPEETRLTIIFEDQDMGLKALKRKKALEAMKRLKGSGNGNLVNALLRERKADQWQSANFLERGTGCVKSFSCR